jgi:hypothetical protein
LRVSTRRVAVCGVGVSRGEGGRRAKRGQERSLLERVKGGQERILLGQRSEGRKGVS